MTRQNEHSIELEQTINAPREKVFPYLLKQDKIIQWFPTRAETDPVVGGHYMLSFEFSEASMAEKGNHTRKGAYKKVDAPNSLQYSWDVGDTDVSFELEARGDKTNVRLAHSGWKDKGNDYQSHLQGWTFFLSNLKSLLEQKKDRRSEEMHLKVQAV